jgi:hypothetical protein
MKESVKEDLKRLNGFIARPHPGLLPQEKGKRSLRLEERARLNSRETLAGNASLSPSRLR